MYIIKIIISTTFHTRIKYTMESGATKYHIMILFSINILLDRIFKSKQINTCDVNVKTHVIINYFKIAF